MKILDNTRRKVFLSMNIIFIILLSGYGIYNSIIKNRVIGIFETSVSLMLIIPTYLFVKKISIFFPVVISMALFYIMAVYLFISGGAQGTGIFWLFVITIIFFFFLGIKFGTVLFLFQYVSVIILFFASKAGYFTIFYNDKTVMFF